MIRVHISALIVATLCLSVWLGPARGQVPPEDRQYQPLNRGIGSQGAQPDPQGALDPTFFFEDRVNWPALEKQIPGGEPRTAWEYAQRGMYKQDELAYAAVNPTDREHYMEEAIADYEKSEELSRQAQGGENAHPRILIVQARLAVIELKQGEELENEGKSEEALASLEKATERLEFVLEESPFQQGVAFLLGEVFEVEHQIYQEMGNTQKAAQALADAVKYFREELKLAPANQRSHYALAELLEEEGETQEALAHLETYLCQAKLHSDTEPWRILKARKKRNELAGGAALDCARACEELYGPERCGG
jgi:tetratricopeptide (TPR) repeat protein